MHEQADTSGGNPLLSSPLPLPAQHWVLVGGCRSNAGILSASEQVSRAQRRITPCHRRGRSSERRGGGRRNGSGECARVCVCVCVCSDPCPFPSVLFPFPFLLFSISP